jgi:hypothetical protein
MPFGVKEYIDGILRRKIDEHKGHSKQGNDSKAGKQDATGGSGQDAAVDSGNDTGKGATAGGTDKPASKPEGERPRIGADADAVKTTSEKEDENQIAPEELKPAGRVNMIMAATKMSINDFLDKYNVEMHAEHQEGQEPKAQAHTTAKPTQLEPTEADEWSDYTNFNSQHMKARGERSTNAISYNEEQARQGKQVGSVMVDGDPLTDKTADVIDGHHRVAGHIRAGSDKINISYNTATLARMWVQANGKGKLSGKQTDDLVDTYKRHLLSGNTKINKSIPDLAHIRKAGIKALSLLRKSR